MVHSCSNRVTLRPGVDSAKFPSRGGSVRFESLHGMVRSCANPWDCSNGGMPNCFRCGKKLEAEERHIRRRVQTGERVARRFVKPAVQSVVASFGMRIVCRRCATAIDREAHRVELISLAKLGLALAILFTILIIQAFH